MSLSQLPCPLLGGFHSSFGSPFVPFCAGLSGKTVAYRCLGGAQFDYHRIIGLAWNRLAVYMNLAWRHLRQKVRQDQLLLSEARALMAAQFGLEGKLWSLHELALQVPPVPPRPP